MSSSLSKYVRTDRFRGAVERALRCADDFGGIFKKRKPFAAELVSFALSSSITTHIYGPVITRGPDNRRAALLHQNLGALWCLTSHHGETPHAPAWQSIHPRQLRPRPFSHRRVDASRLSMEDTVPRTSRRARWGASIRDPSVIGAWTGSREGTAARGRHPQGSQGDRRGEECQNGGDESQSEARGAMKRGREGRSYEIRYWST